MTVPAASVASPFSQDKPLSSDKTMHMPSAPMHPSAGYPLRKMEDATDMEATFVEATQAAPLGSLPSPRLLGSAPAAPPERPTTARMRGSMPSWPPPGSAQFRGPMQTPSADHATIPAAVSPRPFPASQPPHLQSQNHNQSYNPGSGQVPSASPHRMGHPEGLMSGPPVQLQPHPTAQAKSARAIIFISIILIILCAAMGAYVLWRGSLPGR
jgi:hypothetical protein